MEIPIFIFFASQFTIFALLPHICSERPSFGPFILYLLLSSHQSRDEIISRVTTHDYYWNISISPVAVACGFKLISITVTLWHFTTKENVVTFCINRKYRGYHQRQNEVSKTFLLLFLVQCNTCAASNTVKTTQLLRTPSLFTCLLTLNSTVKLLMASI